MARNQSYVQNTLTRKECLQETTGQSGNSLSSWPATMADPFDKQTEPYVGDLMAAGLP